MWPLTCPGAGEGNWEAKSGSTALQIPTRGAMACWAGLWSLSSRTAAQSHSWPDLDTLGPWPFTLSHPHFPQLSFLKFTKFRDLSALSDSKKVIEVCFCLSHPSDASSFLSNISTEVPTSCRHVLKDPFPPVVRLTLDPFTFLNIASLHMEGQLLSLPSGHCGLAWQLFVPCFITNCDYRSNTCFWEFLISQRGDSIFFLGSTLLRENWTCLDVSMICLRECGAATLKKKNINDAFRNCPVVLMSC